MRACLCSTIPILMAATVLSGTPALKAQIVYEISGTLRENGDGKNTAGLHGATLVANASYAYPHVWEGCGFGPNSCTQTFSSTTTVTISNATVADSNGVFMVEHLTPYVVWHESLPAHGSIFGIPGLSLLGGNLEVTINLIVPGNEGPMPGDPIQLKQFVPATYEHSEIQFSDCFYEFVPGSVKISACIPGDINKDGVVDLKDVRPFVELLNATGSYQCEGDINQDDVVDLLDVDPFVELLIGG